MFRRFAGLNIDDSVPDHSTIARLTPSGAEFCVWRFRNPRHKEGHLQPLLDLINDQLNAQGVRIKTGQASMIDASVIEVKNNRPNKNAQGESTQDKDASYNVKTASDGKRKTSYGFKAHINVDEDAVQSLCQRCPLPRT